MFYANFILPGIKECYCKIKRLKSEGVQTRLFDADRKFHRSIKVRHSLMIQKSKTYAKIIMETSPYKSDPRFPPNIIIVKMGEIWGRNKNDKNG